MNKPDNTYKSYFKSPFDGIMISSLFATLWRPEVTTAFRTGRIMDGAKMAALFCGVSFILFIIGFVAIDTGMQRAKWIQNSGRWRKLLTVLYSIAMYAIVSFIVLSLFK